MPIKLIVTDLDGTLLRNDKSISQYTAEVLERCRGQGIRLVFATARPRRTLQLFLGQVPADALILHNGAVAFIGERKVLHHGIEPQAAASLLMALAREFPGKKLSVEIEDVLYANFDVSLIWDNTSAVRSDFTNLPGLPADKIIAEASSAREIEMLSRRLPEDLYIEFIDGKLGMIMHRRATKWNAVRAVSDALGISTADIAAFGDDYNDIGMLRHCGIGVTTENALGEAKAASDEICGSNEEDGVARWLEGKLLCPSK